MIIDAVLFSCYKNVYNGGAPMRRTIIIDDELLEEARKTLGTRSIRATVEASLHETIRRRRVEELRLSLGKIDLDLTLKELARLRNEG
jgi:Arc/MetJ family transcription regulator